MTLIENADNFVDAFPDDPLQGPDGEFADVLPGACPDGGDHVFLTCCGVTRCLHCKAVTA